MPSHTKIMKLARGDYAHLQHSVERLQLMHTQKWVINTDRAKQAGVTRKSATRKCRGFPWH